MSPYIVGYQFDCYRVDLDPKAEEQIRNAVTKAAQTLTGKEPSK